MTVRRRVGVLMGGMSAEREISLRTGAGVAAALASRGHEVVHIAFLALHGRGGEDGCLQGMLELLGVPYTGSSVLASALAMDKLKAKEMFRLHNVPTPPYYVASRGDLGALEDVHGSFGFPVIVKPRGEGSSVGMAKADGLAALALAIEGALAHDTHVLV